MAASSSSYQIPNIVDSTKPFIFVHIPNAIKLTSTNYLSWKMQIEAILIGHDLFKFVDGSYPSPTATITHETTEIPNPELSFWTRQDKLICGALIGTLSTDLMPLVSQAQTSKQLWDILAKTYATPSRGHIKQLKDQLRRITKEGRSITELMQAIKACADQLAALGKNVEQKDLINRVLAGLDDSYSSVIEFVNARDTPISFEKLHEKLINKELSLLQNSTNTTLPATAFAATTRPSHRNTNTHFHPSSQGLLPTPTTTFNRQPRPFLGKCQWCRVQGNVLSKCPDFARLFPNAKPPSTNFSSPSHSSKPQANAVTIPSTTASSSLPWILDSGASHHVTNDIANLSFHDPYDGTEKLLVGDGSQNRGVSIPREI
ncbi:uncharacterized protein LOC110735022 [Chenopodium quinoa]|uniref:uncharacterized protein LOC110735022 n=1 Tax=Chenopodium quinoa TaxID=63459 RepID=UPI000B790847|nr:uncharacterized protein LOC110735022 [Chenopodium quinoa]